MVGPTQAGPTIADDTLAFRDVTAGHHSGAESLLHAIEDPALAELTGACVNPDPVYL